MKFSVRIISILALTFVFSQTICAQQPQAKPPSANASTSSSTSAKEARVRELAKQGVARETTGDLRGAIEISRQILQIDPQNIYAMNTIAGLYGKLNQFNEEINWAQKAINTNAQFSFAYINLDNGYAGLHRYIEAERAYRKAQELDPISPLPAYSLGVLASEQHKFNDVLAFYQKSVAINPKFEDGYFNLAVTYIRLKRYNDAADALGKVLALNPNATDARDLLKQIEAARQKR